MSSNSYYFTTPSVICIVILISNYIRGLFYWSNDIYLSWSLIFSSLTWFFRHYSSKYQRMKFTINEILHLLCYLFLSFNILFFSEDSTMDDKISSNTYFEIVISIVTKKPFSKKLHQMGFFGKHITQEQQHIIWIYSRSIVT